MNWLRWVDLLAWCRLGARCIMPCRTFCILLLYYFIVVRLYFISQVLWIVQFRLSVDSVWKRKKGRCLFMITFLRRLCGYRIATEQHSRLCWIPVLFIVFSSRCIILIISYSDRINCISSVVLLLLVPRCRCKYNTLNNKVILHNHILGCCHGKRRRKKLGFFFFFSIYWRVWSSLCLIKIAKV